MPTSYLDVPVRYDLGPALRWLESEVPAQFGNLEEKKAIPGKSRLHYAYAASRSPFRLAVEGRTATLQADVRYRARAWYSSPARGPSAPGALPGRDRSAIPSATAAGSRSSRST